MDKVNDSDCVSYITIFLVMMLDGRIFYFVSAAIIRQLSDVLLQWVTKIFLLKFLCLIR